MSYVGPSTDSDVDVSVVVVVDDEDSGDSPGVASKP